MKSHFKKLIDPQHLKRTISFIVLFVLCMAGANLLGVSDNPPGIILVFLGMVSIFLSMVHPWKKPSSFMSLAGVSTAIIIILFAGIKIYISLFNNTALDDELFGAFVLITVSFICIPGIFVGLSGAFYRALQSRSKITTDSLS